jgi:hypothetical protein
MAYRKYGKRNYRRKSPAAEILSDIVSIANYLPWAWCIVLGVASFAFFKWVIPAALGLYINSTLDGNQFKSIAEVIILRKAHWLHWLGYACLIASIYFAVRNYFNMGSLSHQGEKDTSLISRIIAKLID